MITFYTNDEGVVMYRNDTFLVTDMLVIERPATEVEIAEFPAEYAALNALQMSVKPTTKVADPALVSEGAK